MAALFARLWLSRSVTDPVGLTVAKPFRTNEYALWRMVGSLPRRAHLATLWVEDFDR